MVSTLRAGYINLPGNFYIQTRSTVYNTYQHYTAGNSLNLDQSTQRPSFYNCLQCREVYMESRSIYKTMAHVNVETHENNVLCFVVCFIRQLEENWFGIWRYVPAETRKSALNEIKRICVGHYTHSEIAQARDFLFSFYKWNWFQKEVHQETDLQASLMDDILNLISRSIESEIPIFVTDKKRIPTPKPVQDWVVSQSKNGGSTGAVDYMKEVVKNSVSNDPSLSQQSRPGDSDAKPQPGDIINVKTAVQTEDQAAQSSGNNEEQLITESGTQTDKPKLLNKSTDAQRIGVKNDFTQTNKTQRRDDSVQCQCETSEVSVQTGSDTENWDLDTIPHDLSLSKTRTAPDDALTKTKTRQHLFTPKYRPETNTFHRDRSGGTPPSPQGKTVSTPWKATTSKPTSPQTSNPVPPYRRPGQPIKTAFGLRATSHTLSGASGVDPYRKPSAPIPAQRQTRTAGLPWLLDRSSRSNRDADFDDEDEESETDSSSGEDRQPLSEEEVFIRTLRGLLNKITNRGFESISEQILSLEITDAKRLDILIDNILEMVHNDDTYGGVYAKLSKLLCDELKGKRFDDGAQIPYRQNLVEKCHAVFDDTDEITTNEDKRRTYSNNLIFIAHLCKCKMITLKIIHQCLDKLQRDENHVEFFVVLLKEVGELIDTDDANRIHLGGYFIYLQCISQLPAERLNKRLRYMVENIIELRENGWVAVHGSAVIDSRTERQSRSASDSDNWRRKDEL